MSVDRFITLLAVAEHRNITRAAEELHVTQPAISKQLRHLQNDYRLTLYYKKKSGGIELTEEGCEFLEYVRSVVRELDVLKMRFNRAPRDSLAPLSVGGTYALASELLPRLLSEFKKAHPLVNAVLRTGSSFTIHDQVLNGRIEVGLVSKPSRSKQLEVQPYSTHPLVAFVHADHPYAQKCELNAAELASAPLVLRGGHRVHSVAESVLKQRGYEPNVVFRGDTPESVRIAVRDNWGVGILIHDAVKNALQRGEFKLLRTPGLVLEAKSFIVYHKERPLSPAAKEFLMLLRKENRRRMTQEEFAGGGRMLRIEGHDSAGYSRVKARRSVLAVRTEWAEGLAA